LDTCLRRRYVRDPALGALNGIQGKAEQKIEPSRHIARRARLHAVAVAVALATGLAAAEAGTAGRSDGPAPSDLYPAPLEAYFPRESYRPGGLASLHVRATTPTLVLRVLQAGSLPVGGIRRDEVRGVAVYGPHDVVVAGRRGATSVAVPIGDWPSGVYFAELRAPGGRVAYAPFVLAPSVVGRARVAVVMPTNTWQAYNRRDADRDGVGDTWYEDPSVRAVDLMRPFLDRGVPPNFNRYDLPFLRWLVRTGRQADVLSQRELEAGMSAGRLARAYDLIVFSGHHEYVTRREYDVVERYRDLGGNLAFLSANNFYWRVTKRAGRMTRTHLWRELGRPEARLVGVQYIAGDGGRHRAAYTVVPSSAAAWLFAGTNLTPGSRFGSFGIEIDHTSRASPPTIEVVARIPNIFGRGKTAEMTYYTRRGARVFAAGAFTLGGSALVLGALLENLWAHLTADEAVGDQDT
jgi:hypothetical protein